MLTPETIREMISGYRTSRILLSALELDIFTAIGSNGKTSVQVANSCGTALRSTEMLLHALCALTFLEKKENVFHNTAASHQWLDRNSPDYLSGLHHNTSLWHSWTSLTESVKEGKTVVWKDGEKDNQKWLGPFIAAMHDRARMNAPSVVAHLRLEGMHKVLDLGGGPGTYAMEMVRQNPEINAFVCDLPEVVALTENYIANAGLTGSVRTIAGDFMQDDIGKDYDLIFLSAIIHSYSPDENRFLLKKCADALNRNGMIVIQDFIMDEDRIHPVEGALFAINMLVNTVSGSTYTGSEVTGWLEEAGFGDIERIAVSNRTIQLAGRKTVDS
ncbi:MAG TPA: methyltransferase [Bacteroidales bacterium]|nr:methyltransferase [Bacteroidales bacterium]